MNSLLLFLFLGASVSLAELPFDQPVRPPWVPVEYPKSLGKLPEFDQEVYTYDLTSDNSIPAEAKEVLLYTFITSIGEGYFQRGYYEIFTSDGGKDFKQYMNVATGHGFNIVNSGNLWFPMTKDHQLKVKLIHAACKKSKNKSIAGRLAGKDWSDVFVIGYRL